ncbi:MAG: hypothetical protein AMXMBFR33_16500 [Candidatus Xenobia bacterium]
MDGLLIQARSFALRRGYSLGDLLGIIPDDQVDYGLDLVRIPKDGLIAHAADQEEVVAKLFDSGASYVHINVIPCGKDFCLTTLLGAQVGNPTPSVNISMETNKSVVLY